MGDQVLATGLVQEREDDIVARTPEDVVAAGAAAHEILARARTDEVFAGIAVDGVVAGMAPDTVRPRARGDEVVPALSVDAVDVVATADGVPAALGLALQADHADDAGAARKGRRCDVDGRRDQAFVAEHEIGAEAADQHVVTETADDVVVAGATVDIVVAALSIQDVAAHAAEDDVGAIDQVREGRDQGKGTRRRAHRAVGIADSRAGAPQLAVASEHHVVAVTGIHLVRAETGHDVVVADSARDVVVAALRKDPVVTGTADDDVVAIGRGLRTARELGFEHDVAAQAAHRARGQCSARQLDRAAVAEDDVVAVASVDAVVASAADDVVVADATRDDVAAGTAVDQVVASLGVDRVLVGAAVETVIARAAPKDVDTVTAPDLVDAVAGEDHVVAVAGIDSVVAHARGDVVVVVTAPDLVGTGARRDHVLAGVAVDDVGAVAGRDGVVALAAEDPVVACTRDDDVVAPDQSAIGVLDLADDATQVGEDAAVADQHVVATGVGDLVVAAAAEDDVGPAPGVDGVVAVAVGRAGAQDPVLHPAVVAEHDVRAAAGVDHVVAGFTVDRVAAGTGSDVVAAEATADGGRTGSGAERDGVIACTAVDLVGDGAAGDAGQIDDVVALARRDNDLADAREALLEGLAAKRRLDDYRVRGAPLSDDEVLAEVVRVVVLAFGSELAHVDLQHATADVVRKLGHAGERNLEIHQRNGWCDVPFLVDREQEEIDLEECEQLGVDLPGDIEHGKRCQCRRTVLRLVQDAARDLGDANASVVIGIEEVEENVREHAAGHTGASHTQVELGRSREAAAQGDLRDIRSRAIRIGGVADVEAVEDQGRVAEVAFGEFLDAERIEAEGEVGVQTELAGDRRAKGPEDREELGVREVEDEGPHVVRKERGRPAEQQAEDLSGVLDDREVESGAFLQARREALGAGCRLAGERRVEVESQVVRCLETAAAGIAEIERGARQRQLRTGAAGVVQRETAEVDQDACGVRRDAVDERDDLGDRLDERDVDVAEKPRDVEQRGRACQVGDHGDRRGDDVDQRLDGLGDLLHGAEHRAHEVADEGAEVEADVLELDDLEAIEHGIADIAQRDVLAQRAIADAPVQEELADDLREGRRGAGHEVAVQLQGEREFRRGVRGDPGGQAEAPELGESETLVTCVAAVVDIDRKGRPQAGTAGVTRVDVRVFGGQLQECQPAGQGRIGQGRLDLDCQFVLVRDVEIEALGKAQPETEVEVPIEVDVEVALGLEPERGQAEVETDAGVCQVDRLAELQVPAHEELVLRRADDVDVGREHDVGDTRRGRAAVLLQKDAQARRPEQLEELLGDEVLVGVGAVLDLPPEVGHEAVAEVPDEAGAVGELVADQGQRDAEDLAVEDVLKPFQEGIDAVDDEQDVVEQAEVGRVQREDVRRNDDVEARRVGQVGRQRDVAAEVGLVRKVDRQGRRRRAVEVEVDVRAELNVRQEDAAVGEDARIEAGTEAGVDARRAILDRQAEPAQGGHERQVIARGHEGAGDPCVVEHEQAGRVGEVDAEGQVDRDRAAGVQARGPSEVVPEPGHGEVHRQGLGEALVDAEVDAQDVDVVAGVRRRPAVVTHQRQVDQVAVLRDAEGFLQLVLEELDGAGRIVPGLLQGGVEAVGVAQQVVDRDVDERNRLIQETEGLEFAQEFGQCD